MKIQKQASALWRGGIKDGRGAITTESGVLKEQPYGFNTRFEGVKGTNPEELIGAAHAGCFTMALSKILQDGKFTAEQLDTKAVVTLESQGPGFAITRIHLELRGKVPGISQGQFVEFANQAKTGCPVSKALNVNITLDAALTS
jgi:osmotically inducible protein OsmC